MMRTVLRALSLAIVALAAQPATRAAADTNALPDWLQRPLTLAEALNIAESQSAAILKAKKDLEAQYGVAIQTRAVALPRVQGVGQYRAVEDSRIEAFGGTLFSQNSESWTAGIQIVQSIYEGGRIQASLRSAKLIKEQAILDYQTVVADTMLAVRVAYDGALLATNQIVVRTASIVSATTVW